MEYMGENYLVDELGHPLKIKIKKMFPKYAKKNTVCCGKHFPLEKSGAPILATINTKPIEKDILFKDKVKAYKKQREKLKMKPQKIHITIGSKIKPKKINDKMPKRVAEQKFAMAYQRLSGQIGTTKRIAEKLEKKLKKKMKREMSKELTDGKTNKERHEKKKREKFKEINDGRSEERLCEKLIRQKPKECKPEISDKTLSEKKKAKDKERKEESQRQRYLRKIRMKPHMQKYLARMLKKVNETLAQKTIRKMERRIRRQDKAALEKKSDTKSELKTKKKLRRQKEVKPVYAIEVITKCDVKEPCSYFRQKSGRRLDDDDDKILSIAIKTFSKTPKVPLYRTTQKPNKYSAVDEHIIPYHTCDLKRYEQQKKEKLIEGGLKTEEDFPVYVPPKKIKIKPERQSDLNDLRKLLQENDKRKLKKVTEILKKICHQKCIGVEITKPCYKKTDNAPKKIELKEKNLIKGNSEEPNLEEPELKAAKVEEPNLRKSKLKVEKLKESKSKPEQSKLPVTALQNVEKDTISDRVNKPVNFDFRYEPCGCFQPFPDLEPKLPKKKFCSHYPEERQHELECMIPNFDKCNKSLYTKCDYEKEKRTHQQIVKIEHLFRDYKNILDKEMKFQKNLASDLFDLGYRYMLLTQALVCYKTYPEIVSIPTEEHFLCEFREKKLKIKKSNASLCKFLKKIECDKKRLNWMISHLDMTVESLFITGDEMQRPILKLQELIEDIYKFFKEHLLHVFTYFNLITPSNTISVEDYKSIISDVPEYKSFVISKMDGCKCRRCQFLECDQKFVPACKIEKKDGNKAKESETSDTLIT